VTPTSGPDADFDPGFDDGIGVDGDSDYPHRLDLSFQYDGERRARLIHDAVAVEVGQIDDERSTARVAVDDEALSVAVFARDLVALRAGTNTWIRLVETAEDVVDVANAR
jgi:KEOPS complex subunit Pcc1